MAIVAGLFVTVVVTVVGAVMFLIARAFGGKSSVRFNVHRDSPRSRPMRNRGTDAIDVTATEVGDSHPVKSLPPVSSEPRNP